MRKINQKLVILSSTSTEVLNIKKRYKIFTLNNNIK